MKKGICPKCNGNNIYTNKDSIRNYGERSAISITEWRGVILDVFICSDCKYFEEYISDSEENEKMIDKMKINWNKV